MKVILLRHGQTEWNALQKYQGHTDIPLNPTGREQAEKIAGYLRDNEEVEAIYCSDLSRGRETAAIIAEKLQLTATCDSRWRELCFGDWEGLTFTEVYEKYPREFDDWFNSTRTIKVPGGESFADVLGRALPALDEIAALHTGTVVVISHGGLIKAVLDHLQGSNGMWETSLQPGSMTILERRGGEYVPVKIGFNL
ncbi:Alpha-ribazole phosphatase, CobC [Syntrophomonas zehnderi OL-4]|uniref:Alpha-ribazole phosphatase n=1 Tax=Syntrophomonas zehnderi OL-4 TaxID=690567 RepID=A0A0E4GBZ2_9FIRM|nr:alpha-ribazole phosphatase [Syntrophomonas zehnderi]CFX97930.1 Alpha-ribazole phosphatase, CobC [Syntrophomonas zehnderi OL-4]